MFKGTCIFLEPFKKIKLEINNILDIGGVPGDFSAMYKECSFLKSKVIY